MKREDVRRRLAAEILCCPDCRSDLTAASSGFVCQSCSRDYPSTECGIECLLPSATLPDDRGQDSEDFRRWIEISAKLGAEYFENGNELFNRIHHSSHRAVDLYFRDRRANGYLLDLGCGTGAHFAYCDRFSHSIGMDISLSSLRTARQKYPDAILIQADAYRLPFRSRSMATVISVYNLEHIFHLDTCLENVREILASEGRFLVGLPTEGGLFWNGGRAMTSGRTIPRRYGIDYKKVIAIEHCNTAAHVLRALGRRFDLVRRTQFPFALLPSIHFNFTVSLEYRLRAP